MTFFKRSVSPSTSAVLNNSITPWINVETDYGAVGDNSADDTTAINNAIAAANALDPGATIFFPPGNYKITGALTTVTRSGVRFVGSGKASTVIWPTNITTDTPFRLFTFNGGSQSEAGNISSANELGGGGVSDMTINYFNYKTTVAPSSDEVAYPITVINTVNTLISNVRIYYPRRALYTRRVGNFILQNCEFDPIIGDIGIFHNHKPGDSGSDVFVYDNVIVAGYPIGADTSTWPITTDPRAKLLILKGRVASHYMKKVQILRGGTGILSIPHDGVGTACQLSVNTPSFISGTVVDLEYQANCAANIIACDGVYLTSLYCVQDIGTGGPTEGALVFGGPIIGSADGIGGNSSVVRVHVGDSNIGGCARYAFRFSNVNSIGISNSVIWNNANGISLIGANTRGTRIQGCHIYGTQTNGFGLDIDTSVPLSNTTVTGCVFNNNATNSRGINRANGWANTNIGTLA